MTINGIDLSAFGATLLSKQISNHEIVQIYDWLDGAASPTYLRTEQRFKDVSVTLLIESASESTTEQYFDALVLQLRNSIIQFEESDKIYVCHFEGKVEPQKLTPRAWLVELELLCYKTTRPEVTITANSVSSKSITSTATLPSACSITVTPSVNIPEFTITGLSSLPIKIKNLTANKAHVIDGYTFRYLKDGASDIANFDAFEWPVLPVGTTNILFSHNIANVTIQSDPRFG